MEQLQNAYQLDRQLFRLYEMGLNLDEIAFLQKHKEAENDWGYN